MSREHVTQQRRPFVRFFGCGRDLSHELPDGPKTDLTPVFLSAKFSCNPCGRA
jgi:hypothetical protein